MIVLLSTSDTDLLSARASGAPTGLARTSDPGPTGLTRRRRRRSWSPAGRARAPTKRAWTSSRPAASRGRAGGEQAPDAELMELSTVPSGGVRGGPRLPGPRAARRTWRNCTTSSSDTLLLTGQRLRPTGRTAVVGPRRWDEPHPIQCVAGRRDPLLPRPPCRRQHLFHPDLVRSHRGPRRARAAPGLLRLLRTAERPDRGAARVRRPDRHRAGGRRHPARASQAGGEDEAWDVGELADLDIPILQGLCLTTDRATWEAADDGLSPLDAAPRSPSPSSTAGSSRSLLVQGDRPRRPHRLRRRLRTRRPGGRGRGPARPPAPHPGRRAPRGDHAVGLPDQALPHRQRRRPRHPAQRGPAAQGPWARPATRSATSPAWPPRTATPSIHALIAAGGQDPDWLTDEQLAGNPVRIHKDVYREHFDSLPDELREAMERHWGPAPASCSSTATTSCWPPSRTRTSSSWSSRRAASARTSSPSTTTPTCRRATTSWPPTTGSRTATTRSSTSASTATSNGCPAKSAGLSAACGPDAALGDLLVYPFLVNDPGGSNA